MTTLQERYVDSSQLTQFPDDYPTALKRVYLARGIHSPEELELRLKHLLSPDSMGSIQQAASIIAQAILNQSPITISGDYDCDGATGTATAVLGLSLLGAQTVHYVVPNRFKHGYGLTPGLVEIIPSDTKLIITVDSGTSSIEGVAAAHSRGMQVVVTDHHLPAEILPNAEAIVNPNLNNDPFPSKYLAGVGVMFYVLIAVRQRLIAADHPMASQVDLRRLLPFVAIGTVADLVPLDHNNRILVQAGLEMIRHGQITEGLKALIQLTRRPLRSVNSQAVAFFIAPRINAVGRMEDMTAGIQLLLTDSPYHARLLADRIESINNERKDLQATMLDQAEDIVSRFNKIEQVGVVVFDPTWHAGIVGLVASRLKESLYRPVIAFAPAEQGSTELRGSGRSIPGFHLRDALALINAKHPGMIAKFGGHAMAAGLTIDLSQLEAFSRAFNALALRAISQEQLDAILPTDGPLAPSELSLAFAERLAEEGPWGQGFPEPVFDNVFYIWEARVLKEAHVKLSLVDDRDGEFYDAIWFNGFQGQTPSGYVRIAYTLEVNRYKKNESVNLIVRYLEPAERPVDARPIQAPVAAVEVVAG